MALTPLDNLVLYANSFLGVEYLYGGDSVFTGMDCSGFVCEVLRSVGLVGHREDLSAQGLFEKFKNNPRGRYIGSLLFFGKSEKEISHVAMAVNYYVMIEAGGGTPKTDSKERAHQMNACVRQRPIDSRGDLVAAIEMRFPWD